ncbi:GFA family protein [Marinobacter algicola]|uniref:GFA family protein n=1 Tax=Marinobacter algicola TaxID=236100 RepID=UPI003BA8645F
MDVRGLNCGTCHCGSVQFEVDLPNGFEDLSRCNCSICARRGAVVTSVPLDAFRILQGAENLTLYQFNTKTAEHYFCSTCGIYTHHRRRSNPNQFGVNVACIEGVNPFELGDIPTTDGINHSSDRR